MIAAIALAVAVAPPAPTDLNTRAEASTVIVLAGTSQGTGFFVEPRRLITAAHVVQGVRTVTLQWAPTLDRAPLTAVVVHVDANRDVAVLDTTDGQGAPLTWADTVPSLGSSVFAIGAPSENFQVTAGVLLAPSTPGYLRSSARAFPGNSGGPLVTADADVVGMVSARQETSNDSLAVPGSILRDVLSAVPDREPSPVQRDVPKTTSQSLAPWIIGLIAVVAAFLSLMLGLALKGHRRRRPTIVIRTEDLNNL